MIKLGLSLPYIMIRVEEESKNLHPQETDDILPTAWKSGSLKYDDKPFVEGGTAKLCDFDKNLGRKVAYKTLHADLRDSDIETKSSYVRQG